MIRTKVRIGSQRVMGISTLFYIRSPHNSGGCLFAYEFRGLPVGLVHAWYFITLLYGVEHLHSLHGIGIVHSMGGRAGEGVIIDSAMSHNEALSGLKISCEIAEKQKLLKVYYLGHDGETHEGQIVVHGDIAERVEIIFRKMLELRFPVLGRVIPTAVFGWNDKRLMGENVTSGFYYL